MRKFLLAITFTIFTVTVVSAQEAVRFGVKGGVSFSELRSDIFYDTGSRTGFHLGFLAEIPMANVFFLQPEVLYSTGGAEGEVKMLGGGPRPTEYEMDYIQVPVLGKFTLFRNFSVEVGPSFNFLIKDEYTNSDAMGTSTVKDFGKSFEFGGIAGASYSIGRGFFGSVRYVHGFTNAFEGNSSVKNRGFQIGVGILL